MIVDKYKTDLPDSLKDTFAKDTSPLPDDDDTTLEEVDNNPLEDVYLAVKRVLESLHTDPNDNNSPKLFQTVKIDNGQFERIVRTRGNTEYAIPFPAAFIRFVNVRYLVAQQRIGEGRATMRIRFVLNDLNNSDDIVETHGFRVFQQINDAIQDAKDYEEALNERCNLTYFDMPESLDHGLQPYWIDYEIWFRTSSSFQYRKWVDRYLVMPKLFQTVKIDNGQFERIVRTRGNTEYAIPFPAAFIRFVNVRYLVAQQRIGEGRATMRIRFVLNDLNNSDDIVETHGFRVFQQINDAIQDAKDYEEALNERCNLTYFDMPESLDHGLQPYWIDYEIWFRTSSSFQYRKWVDRYLVMPPFTNHSDAPEHDSEAHGNHKEPKIEDVAKYEPSVEMPSTDPPTGQVE